MRWIKFLLLPFALSEIPPRFSQMSPTDWRDHSAKVIYNRATQSEIDGWNFKLCAWEMFPAISSNGLYFSSSLSHCCICLSAGQEKQSVTVYFAFSRLLWIFIDMVSLIGTLQKRSYTLYRKKYSLTYPDHWIELFWSHSWPQLYKFQDQGMPTVPTNISEKEVALIPDWHLDMMPDVK